MITFHYMIDNRICKQTKSVKALLQFSLSPLSIRTYPPMVCLLKLTRVYKVIRAADRADQRHAPPRATTTCRVPIVPYTSTYEYIKKVYAYIDCNMIAFGMPITNTYSYSCNRVFRLKNGRQRTRCDVRATLPNGL